MRKTYFFLLSVFFTIAASAQDFYFKHLGVFDGLSQMCILSVYQDEIGAVWLGTSEGLNRYNGEKVQVFRPSQNNMGLTNNEIGELCGNRKGQMYIRSENDLVRLDIYKEQFTCLRQNDVNGLYCQGDTLWVVCSRGVYFYTEQSQKLSLFVSIPEKLGIGAGIYADKDTIWVVTGKHLLAYSRKNPSKPQVLMSLSRPRCISKDSYGNIWVGTWEGLYRLTTDRRVLHYTSSPDQGYLSDNQVRAVQEDDFGCIWFATFRGLDCYQPATESWSHYTRYSDFSNGLSHTSVMALHKDIQGNIWAGTYYGGVNVFNPNRIHNHYYYAEPQLKGCLNYPVVGRMTEDNDGNLWICTEGGGLNRFHYATGEFTQYTSQGTNNSIGNNNLKAIYYRKENDRLYIGTHTGGLSVLDLKSGKSHTLRRVVGDPNSLPNDIVNDIQAYKGGLAILTQGGAVFMDPSTERFSPLSSDSRVQEQLMRAYTYETFLIDNRQRVWLAVTKGGVVCVDLLTSKVTHYTTDTNDPHSIGKFKVDHIFEDSRGEVYFCTVGSGMFKYDSDRSSFQVYSKGNERLPSDYCYYLCESVDHKRLYLLHSNGLSIFDPVKETVEQTYNLFHQSYSEGSSVFVNREGNIFVGGVNGLALFQEEYLQTPPVNTHLSFDKLFLFNRAIYPNDETGILTDILAKTTQIRLNHDQNNLTIEFASFNYRYDRNVLYEYRLDGMDKTWTRTGEHTITYTNLPPGDYTLRLRQLDNHQSPAKEISLNIQVAAPFYASLWAYVFYTLVLIGVVWFIIHFKTRQAALRSSLQFERKEKERIEELNQTKLRFFTNISHEFRTPLTLILGQIEILLQMDKLGPAVYNRVLRIYKNAWQMRNLITELLDFRKQEQGYLSLKVEERDLVAFTKQIYMSFYEYAQRKGISYKFDQVEDHIPVWFDPVQLQKVVFNILSNAFKYTPEKGCITVEVRKLRSEVTIAVSDNGAGIPEESIHKIFERFYQLDNASSVFTLGTGIGLALSKGIMDTHHGKIGVKSEIGKGSTFTLTLLTGNRHFTEEEMAAKSDSETVLPSESVPEVPYYGDMEMEEKVEQVLQQEESADKPVILLVDDNEELLSMLEDMFSPMYEVHIAHNGREGLEMASQVQPDLILSDVMMPEMSGKEMCYKIKNNVELSHISVVLLTAQTSPDYIVEGFMFGADDYVTKPFNVKILLARCNNLIKNKRRLVAHYAGKPIIETVQADAVSEKDRELLEKCIRIVKDNFDNPQFDVTTLASELCMGRSKLYIQFKQMTGLTPNEFILKVKLDEAMSLLKNRPELNISEISIQLGFSSPRYFSKCFKSFFGVAPQGVRKKA